MIPFSTLGERLDFWARASIAYCLMAFLFILNISALPYPLSSADKIPFILIAIYYWSIYRPTFLPPIFVFAAGLLFDLLSDGPLGLYAMLFLGAHWLISDQRRFLMAQSFFIIWLGFGVLHTGILLIEWIVFGIVNMHFASLRTILSPITLGFLSYPLVSFAIHLTHKMLPEPQMPLTRQSALKDFFRNE